MNDELSRAGLATPQARSGLGHSETIANAVERLAINLRSYDHSRGAPRREDDEQVALKSAREIISALEKSYD